jgi:hypothetical protein
MAESKLKRILNKRIDRRIFLWIIWLVFLVSFSAIVNVQVPEPLAHPEYIPTIISGLVASISILIAFAFFFVTNMQTHIKDNCLKRRSVGYSLVYMFILFLSLVFGIVSGYMYILIDNNLKFSFILFSDLFIFVCGLVFDMYLVLLKLIAEGS